MVSTQHMVQSGRSGVTRLVHSLKVLMKNKIKSSIGYIMEMETPKMKQRTVLYYNQSGGVVF